MFKGSEIVLPRPVDYKTLIGKIAGAALEANLGVDVKPAYVGAVVIGPHGGGCKTLLEYNVDVKHQDSTVIFSTIVPTIFEGPGFGKLYISDRDKTGRKFEGKYLKALDEFASKMVL